MWSEKLLIILHRRLADDRTVTLKDVEKTYDVHVRGDHVNTLPARRRMLMPMFGTIKPDIRSLTDEGKAWFDALASMIGSDTTGKGQCAG